jgi:hypothetical protein
VGINGINVPTDDPAALGTRVPYDYQVNPKFTCFTSTKVQILTLTTLRAALGTRVPYDYQVNPKFSACFTSTKVQILTLVRLPGLQEARGSRVRVRARWALTLLLSLLALLVQKCKY